MNAAQAKKKFEQAIATVKRFGVRVTAVGDWGVGRNGEWHVEEGHVCACGALVLACNPAYPKHEVSSWEAVIRATARILRCTQAQAYAVSEGFEGQRMGEQSPDHYDPANRVWHRIGKALRRHAETKAA